MYNAALFVIKSYAHKNIDLTIMDAHVHQTLHIDDSSLTSTNKLIKLLELRDHRHHTFSMLPEAQVKDDLIAICDKLLTNYLKKHDINRVKKQNQKFVLKKVDQFNDDE